ncbi:MAG TPA: flavodoxin domain-containing protein [Bacillota bacterium]|jgi:flavorubredoxin
MPKPFKAVKVSDHVYWVGAVDWGIRDFHGYSTERGSTYNAYLIMADRITLVDTVKAPFVDELLTRISSVTDPSNIEYVVSNHAEMDHSGSLPAVIQAVQPKRVFASVMGVKVLGEHFRLGREIEPLKDGDKLSLGNLELTAIETRMLHWPDSMFTYLAGDGVLFSSDAFGMYLASTGRFDDEVVDWEYQAAKYFANILMPYAPLVVKLLEKVGRLGLDFKVIAPDHGPIWRRDPQTIVGMWGRWAAQKPGNKAIVTYGTMWQSTAAMAKAIAEGLAAGGVDARLLPVDATHRSDIVTELLGAGALLVGSPTLNNNMLPKVADVMTYLRGLKPRNLMGTAFGSYGWSGEAVGQLKDILGEMKVEPVGDGLKVRHVPGDEALNQCRDLGIQVAEKLKEVVGHG